MKINGVKVNEFLCTINRVKIDALNKHRDVLKFHSADENIRKLIEISKISETLIIRFSKELQSSFTKQLNK